MSQKELQRVKVIENAVGGRLRVSEAARLLQLSERQVQRLKQRYRPDRVDWVHHGNRGRPMPWALPAALRRTILQLARGKYRGFNDSHLCEKLNVDENLSLSRESVRRILRRARLASPQKRRPRQYRARRLRRPRFGMMVLTDASRHDWLEGRGPELTLVGFQDDATSQILSAHFQLEAENTLGYMRALHAMVTTHGVPLSLYRDRHGIFQRNDPHWTLAEQLAGKQSPTQLGRACDLDSANHVLARFCADYNQRFAVPARETQCDFRSLPPRFDLDRCLSFRYQRVVGPDHVISFGAHSIALPALPSQHGYAGDSVDLSHHLDGRLFVSYRKVLLLSLLLPLPLPLLEPVDRRPAPRISRQKTKKPMPRIYNLGGRPALAAVT